MSVADWLSPYAVAVIVTFTDLVTGIVAIVNAAVLRPAPTVTVAGGVTALDELVSVTVRPLCGAGRLRVTNPVRFAPP